MIYNYNHCNNNLIIMFATKITSELSKNIDNLNDLFIKCHKIYKQIPPAKNENKFAFGILVQMSLIECLNKSFYKCIDLDDDHEFGSEYKNDCCLYLDELTKVNLSIKAKSKKNGNIIIINNYTSKIERDLSDLITIVVIIENNTIIIIPHSIVDSKYIINSDANISYRGSLITHMLSNNPELTIKLTQNDKFESFISHELPTIKPKNIFKGLFSDL